MARHHKFTALSILQTQAGRDGASKRLAALESRCAGLQADALRASALDRRCAELQAELSAAQQVSHTLYPHIVKSRQLCSMGITATTRQSTAWITITGNCYFKILPCPPVPVEAQETAQLGQEVQQLRAENGRLADGLRESRSREATAVEGAARADAERARLQRSRDEAAAALRVRFPIIHFLIIRFPIIHRLEYRNCSQFGLPSVCQPDAAVSPVC